MVKTPTRGDNILDVFITNIPHFWKKIKVAKSLVRSDHKMIIAYLRETVKASTETVKRQRIFTLEM